MGGDLHQALCEVDAYDFLEFVLFGEQQRAALPAPEIDEREPGKVFAGLSGNMCHRGPENVGINRLVIGCFRSEAAPVDHAGSVASQ